MNSFQTILTIILQQLTAFMLKLDLPQVKQDLISSIINLYTNCVTSCQTTQVLQN